ncbi:MAG: discoidin domain-containing protein [Longimicrobiales bacterium]|nr:discoidin domain-containing protein [Longimicrobiales bacterium]
MRAAGGACRVVGRAATPRAARWVGTLALVLSSGAGACADAGGPAPRVLDPEAQLARFDWWDNRDWDWYAENIPFFESPDAELDATYYYRWELVTKHLTYGSPEAGYTFTEFIDRPFWSGTYGAISCPLGHQAYEVRWLRDPRIVNDFARYWFETPGAQPRSYSNWYGDAMWATYSVLGDTSFLRAVYPHMAAQVDGWTSERWDEAKGMYRWVGAWDGMETNINSRLTDDEFGGAEGYRPTLNSYLWADLRALSRTAALFGDEAASAEYARRADALKTKVQEELWDPERGFFFHQFAFDEKRGIRAGTRTYESGPYGGDPHGRELIGYVPWQFSLPDPGFEGAWAALLDTTRFAAPFGPTTVERGDPQFLVSPTCCVWSGNAWPYATAQTLVAMANLLQGYEQSVVTRDDYMELLRTYALSQRRDGRPYIAEAADPLTGSWDGHNTFYHSEHYFHSGFVDLVITGLVGLRPLAGDALEVAPLAPEEWDWFALDGVRYHGHDVSVIWDRDGMRYGRGAGLSVWADGEVLGRTDGLGTLHVTLPPAVAAPAPVRLHDVAVNNGPGHFPFASASSSHPLAPPFYAVDGSRWYHPSPPNRWVAGPSAEGVDWFEVDFGAERRIQEVDLYFLDDAGGPPVEATGEVERSGFPDGPGATGPSVRPPASYELQSWDGSAWLDVPAQRRAPQAPTGRRANRVTFPELATGRIRVLLHHQPGATSGLTELEAWSAAGLPLDAAPDAPGAAGAGVAGAGVRAARVANLAWNPGDRDFPKVSASHTSESDRVGQAVDGRLSFTRYSRNRWTCFGSANAEDWLEVDFGAPRAVGRVELYLYGDGRGVAAPRSYRVEAWVGGAWVATAERARMPPLPMAWALNVVELEPVETERVRVVFTHAGELRSGLTELRVFE